MGDLGKLIGAKGFKKMPKVQKIAQSGHTGSLSMHKFYINESLYVFLLNKFRSISMRLDQPLYV